MWLLDANMDVHLVQTLKEIGLSRDWKASNGELVSAAVAAGFTCLLTRDQLFGESAATGLRSASSFFQNQFLSEGSANVRQRDHKHHRLVRTWIETEREIEFPGLVRNGVDDDSANTNRVSRMSYAARPIAE
jgi:hypothetical protein